MMTTSRKNVHTPFFARMRNRAHAQKAMREIQDMPRERLDDIGLTPDQAADAMFLSRVVF